MERIEISISKEGTTVHLSVDGVVLGLIEDLRLTAAIDQPVARLKVRFVDVRKLTREQAADTLVHAVDRYRSALKQFPWIEVFEQPDTLPSGMSAVRLEDHE